MTFAIPAVAASLETGGTLASILPFAQAGFSILQGIGQGRAQEQLAAQQSAQLQQQAEAQKIQGDFEAEQVKKQNKAFTGQQLAAYGKSGLDISGTPLAVIGSSLFEQEVDLLARKYNTGIGVSKTLGQAQTVRAEGAVGASTARSRGYAAGFGTLLSRGLNG